MSHSEEQSAAPMPKLVVVKCVSLLVGLPLVLHLALWLTRENYGWGPALIVTLIVGVALSVGYRRPLAHREPEATEETAPIVMRGARQLVSV